MKYVYWCAGLASFAAGTEVGGKIGVWFGALSGCICTFALYAMLKDAQEAK